eukprot:TRINITY_DN3585_c0_g3_i3.p4 TRINITY_DN3585_c0_g3~~TRINITY_DN3585_c0_g3_i3.p4  ORF type:complete len:109 (-),score=30.95 TRINITY_DN3585_c0_g3_i3:401-727(-)
MAHLNRFLTDWNKYLDDIKLDIFVNFPLEAGEKKVFLLNVDKLPAIIRGAYSATIDETNNIVFNIVDPKGVPIFVKSYVAEVVIYVNATRTGLYTIEFMNENVHCVCS